MTTVLFSAFLASLLGSLHCAAMCGGLVSFTCGSSRRPVVEQLGYHLARVLTYATLGGVAGYAGQTLNRTTLLLGWQNTAAWLTGGAMMVWALLGLSYRVGRLTPSGGVRLASKPKRSRLSVWFAWLHKLPTGVKGPILGVTTALLPCGWLYTFVVAAAGQGSAWGGAWLMLGFAMGSVPILVGVGSVARVLSERVRQFMPQLNAIVLLVLGLTTVLLRAPLPIAPRTELSTSTPHSCH